MTPSSVNRGKLKPHRVFLLVSVFVYSCSSLCCALTLSPVTSPSLLSTSSSTTQFMKVSTSDELRTLTTVSSESASTHSTAAIAYNETESATETALLDSDAESLEEDTVTTFPTENAVTDFAENRTAIFNQTYEVSSLTPVLLEGTQASVPTIQLKIDPNELETREDERISRFLEEILAGKLHVASPSTDEFDAEDEDEAERTSDANATAPLDLATETTTTSMPTLVPGVRQSRAKNFNKFKTDKPPAKYTVAKNKNKKVSTTTVKPKRRQSEEERMARYNGYVDAILQRMNTMIRAKRMDPLRVNLFAGNGSSSTSTSSPSTPPPLKPPPKKGKDNRRKQLIKNKQRVKGGNKNKGPKVNGNKNAKNRNRPNKGHNRNELNRRPRPQRLRPPRRGMYPRPGRQGRAMEDTSNETRVRPAVDQKSGPFRVTFADPRSENYLEKSDAQSDVELSAREMKGGNTNRPVRGILHGLATIRRSGPVKVMKRAPSVRIVKAKFLLGPVALDILPKKNANASKASNIPTATATARALKGIIEISLKKGGITKIRKLRVHPPSSVKFDGEGSSKGRSAGYRKLGPVAAQRLLMIANQVLGQTRQQRNHSRDHDR